MIVQSEPFLIEKRESGVGSRESGKRKIHSLLRYKLLTKARREFNYSLPTVKLGTTLLPLLPTPYSPSIETKIVNEAPDLSAERIESLKAGTLAALSFTLTYCIAVVVNNLVLAEQFEVLAALQVRTAVNLLVRVASAWISGFLFGITYRYVVRDDENPHLKEGAVLAFGLVRGLAPVEVEQNLRGAFWFLGVLGVESVFCFLVARLTLDWALHRHWVKPFKSS
jgi:hypothetical protein